MRANAARALLAVLGVLAVSAVRAAHPTFTEDTGTQGAGQAELELGFQQVRDGANRDFEFGPQFSWGVLPHLDLILRPTWLDLRGGDSPARGSGDAALDIKWRFLELHEWSLGVRAGFDLPTGDAARGLGAGKPAVHATLIATRDARPWSFSANAGWIRAGADPAVRRDQYLVSVSVLCNASARVKLSAEMGASSNPDPLRSTWPLVARAGMIVVANDWLDVDVGYESRLNRAAPERTLLAGATLRW